MDPDWSHLVLEHAESLINSQEQLADRIRSTGLLLQAYGHCEGGVASDLRQKVFALLEEGRSEGSAVSGSELTKLELALLMAWSLGDRKAVRRYVEMSQDAAFQFQACVTLAVAHLEAGRRSRRFFFPRW